MWSNATRAFLTKTSLGCPAKRSAQMARIMLIADATAAARGRPDGSSSCNLVANSSPKRRNKEGRPQSSPKVATAQRKLDMVCVCNCLARTSAWSTMDRMSAGQCSPSAVIAQARGINDLGVEFRRTRLSNARAASHWPEFMQAVIKLPCTTVLGSNPPLRISRNRANARRHSPAVPHALMAALYVTTFGSTWCWCASPNKSQARRHCAPFSHALIVALYVTTLG
mmetsp:Transcript_53912/g.149935  ORF Transcript_53912/g.149935 Transcript_53912/m.149935 type:complete len:225 (+) Transcript_53912:647-1321(+)